MTTSNIPFVVVDLVVVLFVVALNVMFIVNLSVNVIVYIYLSIKTGTTEEEPTWQMIT